MKVDYEKIYEGLERLKGKTITASGLAHATGVDRIYGGTMAKLVREGCLDKCPLQGYYKVV